jgi:hypothetical protein
MRAMPCRFGTLGITSPLPDWLKDGGRQIISTAFANESRGEIQLDTSVLTSFDGPYGTGSVAVPQLYGALQALIATPINNSKTPTVGVLFAERFVGQENIFGVMFDTGPGFDGFSSSWCLPRLGCAIFLGAIGDRRKGAEYEDESLFTTIHELGHVFNLWHTNIHSYMYRSATLPAPVARSQWYFAGEHEDYLTHCSTSNYVMPGGSTFGERGSLGPPESQLEINLENASTLKKTLDFEILLTEQSFFTFYPVELELRISLKDGMTGSLDLPNVIDPGYPDFQIWLEEPDGERRMFRSPRHYCGSPSFLTITPARPFERDISVFGDADGFFFRKTGDHKIWACLRLSDAFTLKSNILGFRILRADARKKEFERLSALLTNPNIAKLLYHRFGSPHGSESQVLQQFVKRHPKARVSASIHYALGRSNLNYSTQSSDALEKSALSTTALLHLNRAVDHRALSPHRRTIAERLIHSLSS